MAVVDGPKRGLSRSVGHRYGIENLKTVVELSLKFKIKFLTVYAFQLKIGNVPKMRSKHF